MVKALRRAVLDPEFIKLPKKKQKGGRGTSTAEDRRLFARDSEAFIWYLNDIKSRLDFDVGLRGWAYLLESHGLIDKSQFDEAQGCITEFRKQGRLPINFTARDEERSFTSADWYEEGSPEEWAQVEFKDFLNSTYWGADFWEDKDVFIMMLVEKSDLKRLFEPICKNYCIPIATGKGWSDLHQRWYAAQKFKEHEEQGRTPVILYCGDHDPDGLLISNVLKDNFRAIQNAVWEKTIEDIEGWNPENLIVDRFGLNADFIGDKGLAWIENLITSSGKDYKNMPRHKRPKHVNDYIDEFGFKKCEANAIVVNPDAGRQLGLEAINRYVPKEALDEFNEKEEQVSQEGEQAKGKVIDDYYKELQE